MRKSILQSLLLVFLGLLGGFLTPSDCSAQDDEVITTLAGLDAIVERANNLDEFLSNETIINDYFIALNAYYGDSFQRESFDRILEQIKEIKDKVPGFKERIWEEIKAKEYTLTVEKKKYNRDLKPEGWKAFLEDWQRDLRGEQKGLDKEKAFAYLDSVAEEIKTHDEALRGLSKKKRNTKNAQFYRELQARNELRETLRELLLEYLQADEVQAVIKSTDADKLIDWIDELGEKTEEVLSKKFPDVHPRLLRMLKESIPKKKELLQREDIFSKLAAHKMYKFVPVKKRIHGIWKGVTLKECVGGSCQHLKSTSPSRWASSLLEGAVLYHVEADARYVGFIQKVPIRHTKNKRIYVSVDFGAPVLSQTAIEVGSGKRLSLYSLWLPLANEHLSEDQMGLLVSESDHVNNARVLDKVRLLPSYALADGVGEKEDFEHVDKKFASDIVDASKFNDFGESYKGSMIFDAVVSNAGELVCLDHRRDQKKQDIKTRFREVLEKGTQKQKTRAVNSLYDFPLSKLKRGVIDDLLDKNIADEARATLRSIVAIDTALTKLSESKDPNEFFEIVEKFYKQIKKDSRDIRSFREVVRLRADHFIDIGATVQEFRKFIEKNGMFVEDLIELKEKGLKLVKKPQDYLDLIRSTKDPPSDAYREAIGTLITKTSDQFFSLRPTELQLKELGVQCLYSGCAEMLLEQVKKWSPTAQEFVNNLAAVRGYWIIFKEELKSKVDRFITDNLSWFEELNPSGSEYRQLSNIAYNIETTKKVRSYGAKKVKSISEFIALFNDNSARESDDSIEESDDDLMSDGRQDALSLALIDSLSLFYRLRPNDAAVRRLEAVTNSRLSSMEKVEGYIQGILKLEDPGELIKESKNLYKELKKELLAKALLKRELRHRISKFIARKPSFKQRGQFVVFLGGTRDEIEAMARTCLKDAAKATDFLDFFVQLYKRLPKEERFLLGSLLSEFSASFVQTNPSLREVKRFLSYTVMSSGGILGSVYFAVKAQKEFLENMLVGLKNIPSLFRLLRAFKTSVSNPSARCRNMFDQLILDDLEDILALSPSMKEMKELAEIMHETRSEILVRKRAIKRAKTFEDYEEILKPRFLSREDHRKAMSELAVESINIFIEQFKEVADLKLYEKKFVQSLDGSIILMEKGLSLVKNADDYLKLVSFSAWGSDDEQKIQVSKFVERSLDVFFAQGPSIEQIRSLIRSSIFTVGAFIEVYGRGIQSCKSPHDFLEIVEIANRNPSEEYEVNFEKILIDYVKEFFSYPEKPTVAQIIKLMKRTPYFNGKKAIMQAALPYLKDSNELIQLLAHTIDSSHVESSVEYGPFVDSLLRPFIRLAPSDADIEKFSVVAKLNITQKDIVQGYLGGRELELSVMERAGCFIRALRISSREAL